MTHTLSTHTSPPSPPPLYPWPPGASVINSMRFSHQIFIQVYRCLQFVPNNNSLYPINQHSLCQYFNFCAGIIRDVLFRRFSADSGSTMRRIQASPRSGLTCDTSDFSSNNRHVTKGSR